MLHRCSSCSNPLCSRYCSIIICLIFTDNIFLITYINIFLSTLPLWESIVTTLFKNNFKVNIALSVLVVCLTAYEGSMFCNFSFLISVVLTKLNVLVCS